MAKQRNNTGKKQVDLGFALRRRLWLLVLMAFIPAAATYFLAFALMGQWLAPSALGFIGSILLVGAGCAAQLRLNLSWREVSTGGLNFLVITVLGALAGIRGIEKNFGFFLTAVLLLSSVYLLVLAGVALSKFLPLLERGNRQAGHLNKKKQKSDRSDS